MELPVEKEKQKVYVGLEGLEKLLPKVNQIVKHLQNLNKTLELFDSVEIEVADEDYEHFSYVTKFNKAFHRLSYDFYAKLHRLEKMGAHLRDLDEGLVDFLFEFEGRDVFLCWKLGEESIDHWHEVGSGFEGRKRIMDLTKRKIV